MKFKLDENLGTRIQKLFHVAGHNVKTTADQKLQRCSDQHLYEVCCAEQRCLYRTTGSSIFTSTYYNGLKEEVVDS